VLVDVVDEPSLPAEEKKEKTGTPYIVHQAQNQQAVLVSQQFSLQHIVRGGRESTGW
jgi:hypothetical protein